MPAAKLDGDRGESRTPPETRTVSAVGTKLVREPADAWDRKEPTLVSARKHPPHSVTALGPAAS